MNFYFVIDNLPSGQTVELRYFDPGKSYKWVQRWNPLNNGVSSLCFFGSLDIAANIAPAWGTWTAQVYVNSLAIGSVLAFRVDAGSTQTQAPNPLTVTHNASNLGSGLAPGVALEGKR